MAPQDWTGFQLRAAIREQGFTAKSLQDIDSALRLNPFNNELMVAGASPWAKRWIFRCGEGRGRPPRITSAGDREAIFAHFARAVVKLRQRRA